MKLWKRRQGERGKGFLDTRRAWLGYDKALLDACQVWRPEQDFSFFTGGLQLERHGGLKAFEESIEIKIRLS